MAAENVGIRRRPVDRRPGFNEAAAHGRGKRTGERRLEVDARSFNEAAAHGRGKREQKAAEREQKDAASMRPRRMAAENW